MSRAFVKEDDGSRPEPVPEIPVSPHPNLVTPRGLRLIAARIAERYWTLRRATARPTAPDPADPAVQFGSRVSYLTEDGATHTVTITGEDEADPASGRIPWPAPLARALMGATPGSSVTLERPTGPVELEILRVGIAPEAD